MAIRDWIDLEFEERERAIDVDNHLWAMSTSCAWLASVHINVWNWGGAREAARAELERRRALEE